MSCAKKFWDYLMIKVNLEMITYLGAFKKFTFEKINHRIILRFNHEQLYNYKIVARPFQQQSLQD